ncbi:hypothetical protein [Nonomuraea sp. NPDC005650]|uniref:hypothetical protein n=1 Tax=Nonomuraea sp. NPDC005650 TaxID=3157045 RepID=UPI0033A01385
MSGLASLPCGRCGINVIEARALGGGKYVLDAVPVHGGDIAIWPMGNDPSQLTWRCKARPAEVPQPYSSTTGRLLDIPGWDGGAAANARKWYVEHQHGLTSAEIVARRRSS